MVGSFISSSKISPVFRRRGLLNAVDALGLGPHADGHSRILAEPGSKDGTRHDTETRENLCHQFQHCLPGRNRVNAADDVCRRHQRRIGSTVRFSNVLFRIEDVDAYQRRCPELGKMGFGHLAQGVCVPVFRPAHFRHKGIIAVVQPRFVDIARLLFPQRVDWGRTHGKHRIGIHIARRQKGGGTSPLYTPC